MSRVVYSGPTSRLGFIGALKPSEIEVHAACVEQMRAYEKVGWLNKSLVWFPVRNEGKRGWKEQAHMRKTGFRPGVSDIVLITHDNIGFAEIKGWHSPKVSDKTGHLLAQRQGVQSEAQLEFETEVSGKGYSYGVFYDDVVYVEWCIELGFICPE